MNMKKFIKGFIWLLFLIYIAVLVYFLFFCEKYGRTATDDYHYNLIPFSEMKRYFIYYDLIGFKGFFLNIIGNILAFVPLGICIPLLVRGYRKFLLVFFYGILFTVCVETIQLLLKVGSFDVDDMILNTLGVAIGYVCYYIFYKWYKRKR